MKKSSILYLSILLLSLVIFVWLNSINEKENKIKAAPKIYPVEYQTTESTEKEKISTQKETLDDMLIELPAYAKNDQIIYHYAYTLCYDEKYEQASWVAYELTKNELIKRYDRTNRFIIDNAVQTRTADDQDYKRSGYDRGHLAPAGDMSWSATAMQESFYYSNMSPQDPSFNRGIWKKLEEQVRTWADEMGAVYIVTGPVLRGNLNTIGNNQVAIPNYYYKVVLSNTDGNAKAIGFILKNEGSKSSLYNYAVSIDSVEKFTGIDFFPNLSDELEKKIEKSYCVSCWSWTNQWQETNNTSPNSAAIQCSGTTKKGLRCKRMTKDPSGKCYQHD
jgi:endonuclease G